ncbi:MAG: sporulation peptidase YabG [Clostridium sp.]|nr:sporulation peptidase YabG [Clostridium sp.]MCM1444547.1 sporulation peptidase YabG [Candidatus Amulumruptor caecigallinarius]
MNFEIGDLVTRTSHNNDLIFIITDIIDDIYYLKGLNIRLIADALKEDLNMYKEGDIESEKEFLDRIKPSNGLDRSDYFYLPGKILHIDGDKEYLDRCLKYYNEANIWAIGINEKEENIQYTIKNLLEEYRPNIVIITGHDAYYKGKTNEYKNSDNFINAVKEARKYEMEHDKLIIIAGACQSNYEELIKAGANFASSPKRINIHALDPAIIATKISLTNVNTEIDIKSLLKETKYGSSGIGGIITKGTMYVGYPR